MNDVCWISPAWCYLTLVKVTFYYHLIYWSVLDAYFIYWYFDVVTSDCEKLENNCNVMSFIHATNSPAQLKALKQVINGTIQ